MSNQLDAPPPELLALKGRLVRHYKGGVYRVIAIVRNTESKKLEVVYQSEDNPDDLPWVRPAYHAGHGFMGMATVGDDSGDGWASVPRFELLNK